VAHTEVRCAGVQIFQGACRFIKFLMKRITVGFAESFLRLYIRSGSMLNGSEFLSTRFVNQA
jgi:hypothetical protein